MADQACHDSLTSSLILKPSMVPATEEDFDCCDSDFFRMYDKLPTPSEVRAQAYAQYCSGESLDKRRSFGYGRKPPASYPSMGLFVKWGHNMKFQEFQTLYAINRVYNGTFPVPQVYGWRVDDNEGFLYMELVEGVTLEQAWDSLESDERISICCQLRDVVQNIRQLRQDPTDSFAGTVGRGCLYDRGISVSYMKEAGPFSSVQEFHNWFTFLHRRPFPYQASIPLEPYRHDMPDDAPIRLTHGDLHRSNIIVSHSRPYRILALIDWEQSGWLPDYWEDCKAHFTAGHTEEWATRYLPMILHDNARIREAWDYYTYSMGAF